MKKNGDDAGEGKANEFGGSAGPNGNWPGCTPEFVKRTEKRRKRNKLAKKSRKKNR